MGICCSQIKKEIDSKKISVYGGVSSGYETVKNLFLDNFTKGKEMNAQLCVYVKGKMVIDLFGTGIGDKQFNPSTLINTFSNSKTLSAIVMARLVDQRLLSYDDKISTHWPEFGQNGKEDITVAELMRHEAGLIWFDHRFDVEDFYVENIKDNSVGSVIEKEEKCLECSGRIYHAFTRGWIENEIVRRVDPEGRTIGEILREEISNPLGAMAFIGLKKDELKNVARVKHFSPWKVFKENYLSCLYPNSKEPKSQEVEEIEKESLGCMERFKLAILMCKTISPPKDKFIVKKWCRPQTGTVFDGNIWNSEAFRLGESPSCNAHCTARGLALIGAAMANKGTINYVEVVGTFGWEALHDKPITKPWEHDKSKTSFTQGGINQEIPQNENEDSVLQLGTSCINNKTVYI